MPIPLRITAPVGAGGSALVFRAELPDGQPVALKVARVEAEAARFAAEAELLALARGPGIARVLDVGRTSSDWDGVPVGRPYLVLSWAEGRALDPRAVAEGNRESLTLALARDLGEALASLHDLGIAHGDVKPDNVVVDDRGAAPSATLVDLGLSANTDETVPRGGTIRYLAPARTAADGDARARDLYALGLVLAETASASVARSDDPTEAARSATLPDRVAPLVRALLSRTPGARPSASWVAERARDALGAPTTPAERGARADARIARTYLGVRRPELRDAVRAGRWAVTVDRAPGDWLRQAVQILRRAAELRGADTTSTASAAPAQIGDLTAFGRAEFLTSLVGVSAARFPPLTIRTDAELVERLSRFAAARDLRSLLPSDLTDGAAARDADDVPQDPMALAIALGASAPSPLVLLAAEHAAYAGSVSLAFLLALGRALRLSGQSARADAVLALSDSAETRAERAECARRLGDRETAVKIAEELDPGALSEETRARLLALRARVELDRGSPERAGELLAGAPGTVPILEVRALLSLAAGRMDEARQLAEDGKLSARTDEQRARFEGVLGNVAQAEGNAELALGAFRRAVDHAVRAGAVLEEATYLTGVAAAGEGAGTLGEALEAATRATLLFEHLGRGAEAARALLSRAAVYAACGATTLAKDAAEQALVSARKTSDTRCRAFCHLLLSDVADASDSDGVEHARRAETLLGTTSPEDRLRGAARLLAHGVDVSLGDLDALADGRDVPAPAKLEWWNVRARLLSRERTPVRADRVLQALAALATTPCPVSLRGEALAAGAALAARVGDGDGARRFSTGSVEAATRLLAGAPPELRTSAAALPWIAERRSPRETAIAPEQLADVEALVRALGTRDRLRPLLDQVLDALVLWTGVERGLLLLRAPGGRLVPRAARNIAREDLHGVQLTLSRSLAERALGSGEPVVAVDATGELPEMVQSVHALRLRSVLAVPLVARGEALGVVYLDDRVRRGAFGPNELAWVRLVATLAAVAIAEARDQLSLRRAARRARRAEERIASLLSRREAELGVAERELARVRGARETRYAYDEILGESREIRALLALVDRVTDADVPVLVAGESGSGKELVARAIHRNGPRGSGPFVSENCGAIPETLLETTLFGHVRGAFTGATRPHAGLFEIASGGTLFLDEIGEMSLGMQTKLLRVLEDGEVRPVGSERARKVDVRVVAATHRDLAKMVEQGTFRRDLFYRLNVISIDVPPLRGRTGDIEILARRFVGVHSGGRGVRLSHAALEILSRFSWPGNVRQLENEVRRALVLCDGVILPEHLSEEVRNGARGEENRDDGLDIRRRVDALEASLVRTALERTRGNQTRAAELLGLSRFGLQKMIRRLEIQLPASALRDDGGAVTGDR